MHLLLISVHTAMIINNIGVKYKLLYIKLMYNFIMFKPKYYDCKLLYEFSFYHVDIKTERFIY